MNTDDFILRSILYSHCLLSHLYKSSGGSMICRKTLGGPKFTAGRLGTALRPGPVGPRTLPGFWGVFFGGDTFMKVYSSYTRQNIRTINNKKNMIWHSFSIGLVYHKRGDHPLKIRRWQLQMILKVDFGVS